MRRRIAIIALTIMSLSMLLSCRKDLCYNHDEHSLSVKVKLVPEWEQEWERKYSMDWKKDWNKLWGYDYDQFKPAPGKGIRVFAYQGSSRLESNLPAAGGRIYMNPGVSDLLFHNNDTEYLVYRDMTASTTASATTRTLSRGGFQQMKMHEGERTMNQPDMLYGAFKPGYEAFRTIQQVDFPVVLHPLVYTYYIRYEFKSGQKYVALARGALAGMAESVYLEDGHTGAVTSTIMYECELKDFGVEAKVKTFGVANYPGDHYTKADGSPAVASLNLEVRMKNGKFKTFEFDITKQVMAQPRGGVIIVKDLEITDKEGLEGSGAFKPEVDGWGDFIDVPLPL